MQVQLSHYKPYLNKVFPGAGESQTFPKKKKNNKKNLRYRAPDLMVKDNKKWRIESFECDPSHSSGPYYATNFCGIPYPQSAYDGKKNDDNDGEGGGLTVRMYHHIEVHNQSLHKSKEDYHHG
jgi:hypothetical protein